MYKIMTPGPTEVRESVRFARSIQTTNPDIDFEFFDYYKETCELISKLLCTKNETIIMSGEGILGLEAACASLTEPFNKVLVIDNGIFGKGFADFVSIYGGIPVLYTRDYNKTLDINELEEYLEENHDFKYATIVHCDTPSGMLNDISKICPLLKKYGILTVVDSVSAAFGHEIDVDASNIDVLCCGSQKVISAPVGLTIVTVSEDAKYAMQNRKTPISSFYANLSTFWDYYKKKWFPYTMPISDIYGLRVAIDHIKADTEIYNRHASIAKCTREAIREAGLTLYLESGYSNTVTVFHVPNKVSATNILKIMKEKYNIIIDSSFGPFAGKVIRIGHMGENATINNMVETLDALDGTFQELDVVLMNRLKYTFLQRIASSKHFTLN